MDPKVDLFYSRSKTFKNRRTKPRDPKWVLFNVNMHTCSLRLGAVLFFPRLSSNKKQTCKQAWELRGVANILAEGIASSLLLFIIINFFFHLRNFRQDGSGGSDPVSPRKDALLPV